MKKRRRAVKNSLMMLLCCAAAIGLAPVQAYAADNGTSIQAGAGGISDYSDAGGYDYIYFGEWNGTQIKWRVLDADNSNMDTDDNGIFLLSESLLETEGGVYFDNVQPISNAWQGSTAQEW